MKYENGSENRKVIINRKHAALIGGGMLILLAAAAVFLYFRGYFLPSWISWEERSVSLNEYYTLEGSKRCARLYSDTGEVVWESPKEYRVQDIACVDIDRDKDPEILLLAWKIGKYGNAHPFFEKEHSLAWSQHIYIYDVTGAEEPASSDSSVKMRSIYGASDVGMEVISWSFDEDLCMYLEGRDGNMSRFSWAEWGLVPVDNSLSILAFGDNLIHETCYIYGMQQRYGNFDYLYEDLREEIKGADYSFLNLETILVDRPEAYGGYPRFGTPIEVGQAIARAGFSGVTSATNHSLDRGAYGLNTTMDFCRDRGLICLGIGGSEYEVIQKGGIKVGLCNYTYGVNNMPIPKEMTEPDGTQRAVNLLDSEERVKKQIRQAAKECDAVVVFVHWGEEYGKQPDKEQRMWADVFQKAGASAVIGTHPHVVQPLDDSTGIPVFYSIGNLVSSQQDGEKNEGAKAFLRFEKRPDGICLAEYEMTRIQTRSGQ